MKAIIPTGGRGTRMQPLTFSTNKHFIPLANKPLIFYPIEAVAASGIKEVAITYNPGWLEMIKEILGDGKKWGLKFTYVLQEKPLGLANIFQVCEEYLAGEAFVLHLGDNIFTQGITTLVEHFLKEKPNAQAVYVKTGKKENVRMGVPFFDKKGKFIKYVEKPQRPPNDYGITGLYFFDNTVFKCFEGKNKITPSSVGKLEVSRGELEISLPYNWLIKNKYRVDAILYKDKWLDPGKFDDWIETNQHILENGLELGIEGKVKKDSKVEGRVGVGRGSEITASEIRGPVVIGKKVKIINSYVGPYTSIDDGCVIENSQIENSVVMRDVVIKNIQRPIDKSLIGTAAEIQNADGPSNKISFFIGEKSVVKI